MSTPTELQPVQLLRLLTVRMPFGKYQGNDTKILSVRGDIAPPNRAKVIRETSQSLAQDVYQQLTMQLGYSDPKLSRGVRAEGTAPMPTPAGAYGVQQPAPMPAPQPQQPDQVLILR